MRRKSVDLRVAVFVDYREQLPPQRSLARLNQVIVAGLVLSDSLWYVPDLSLEVETC
jgi:hypothetical protein